MRPRARFGPDLPSRSLPTPSWTICSSSSPSPRNSAPTPPISKTCTSSTWSLPTSVGPKWQAYFDGFKGREAGDLPHSAVIDQHRRGRPPGARQAAGPRRDACRRRARTRRRQADHRLPLARAPGRQPSIRWACWKSPRPRTWRWPSTACPRATWTRVQHRRPRRQRAHEAARPPRHAQGHLHRHASAPSSCTSPTPSSGAGCMSDWRPPAASSASAPTPSAASSSA